MYYLDDGHWLGWNTAQIREYHLSDQVYHMPVLSTRLSFKTIPNVNEARLVRDVRCAAVIVS